MKYQAIDLEDYCFIIAALKFEIEAEVEDLLKFVVTEVIGSLKARLGYLVKDLVAVKVRFAAQIVKALESVITFEEFDCSVESVAYYLVIKCYLAVVPFNFGCY